MTRRRLPQRTTTSLPLVLVLAAAAGCGDDAPEARPAVVPPASSSAPAPPPPSSAAPTGGTVGQAGAEGGLSQEALRGRIGQTATVTGEVAELVGANAFTLGGDTIGEDPVLVVSAKKAQVSEGDQVRVSGKVIRFSTPGVERDLDLDLVDNEFEEFAGEAALQADQVQRAAAAGPGDGGQGGAAQDSLDDRVGQEVTLRGEVAEMVGPNAFTVGGDTVGENPVLVVSADAPGVRVGDTVRLTGTVIRFSVTGVERDLDLDLVDDEFADFDGDPAVRATTVRKQG